ncbi:MAG: hypothetical protein WC901_06035 [Candidatus Margulisiibacteriota bacterium]
MDLIDRMQSCQYLGTPQCPNFGDMKYVVAPEKLPGSSIQYITVNTTGSPELQQDAQFCKECGQYKTSNK